MIKIDENGWLYILRGKKLKSQFCPFDDAHGRCGDWCPHFGEPFLGVPPERYYLELCDGKLISAEKLIDARGGNDGKK